MNIYTSVSIDKHHAGFGMYQRGEVQSSPTNSYRYLSDLISDISDVVDYCLDIEQALVHPAFIEKGVEDIRGNIYNQPTNIHVMIDNHGELSYFGVVESEVPDNYFD